MRSEMKSIKVEQLFALLLCAALTICLTPQTVEAQCAMCKTAVQAGGERTAATIRTAMLVLLIPSVTLFCSIFVVVLRYARKQDVEEGEEGTDG